MSTVLTTLTPFINGIILSEALTAIGCKHTVFVEVIILDNSCNQHFELQNGRYVFVYDTDERRVSWGKVNNCQDKTIKGFLKQVEKSYHDTYEKHLQIERERLEAERRAYVEKQKQTVITKAKAQGYAVREERVKDKTKLVLVRNTY